MALPLLLSMDGAKMRLLTSLSHNKFVDPGLSWNALGDLGQQPVSVDICRTV